MPGSINLAGILPALILLGGALAQAQVQQPEPAGEVASTPVSEQITEPPLDARDRIFYPGDTENLKLLGRKLLANTLLDQKEIWTSWFHLRARDVPW
jgi:hypothetical protein